MKIFPPVNPKWIPLIVEAGKNALQLIHTIIENKIKTVSEKQPLTKESSAEDFQEINQFFLGIQKEISYTVAELESKVGIEVRNYLEELSFLLNSNSNLNQKYNFNIVKYEQEIKEIEKKCEGYIEKEVAISINLFNPEIREILTMLPGQKKQLAMKNLLIEKIEKALKSFSNYFQEEVNYLASLIEEDLNYQIIQLKRVDEELIKQLKILEDSLSEGSVKNDQLQVGIYTKLFTINKLDYLINN